MTERTQRRWVSLCLAIGCASCAGKPEGQTAGGAAATPTPAGERVLSSCSVQDQFTFSLIGTALDATNVGVPLGATIADSSSYLTGDGSVRKYFFAGGKGIMSAISADGITCTSEGVRLEEGKGSHSKLAKLDDHVDKSGGSPSFSIRVGRSSSGRVPRGKRKA